MAGRIGGLEGLGGVGGLQCEGAEERGTGAGARPVLVDDGVEHVDGDHVGEFGNGDVGQLPGGLCDVQGGADTGGAVGDQGQTPPRRGRLLGRLVTLGDVRDKFGHPEHAALGVFEPVDRDRPGVQARCRVGRAVADDGGLVDQGHPVVEDLPHRGFGHLELRSFHDLAVVAAEVVFRGDAVHLLHRGVDGHVPQVGVEDCDSDGGLGDQPGGEGYVPLHLAQCGRVGAQPKRVEVAAVVQEPHVAQLHQSCAAVLSPDGERAIPAPARLHDLGKLLEHPVAVLLGDEQLCGVLPERFLGGVAVQLLGLRTPQDDPALGVQQHCRHSQKVQQPTRLRWFAARSAAEHLADVGGGHSASLIAGTPSARRRHMSHPSDWGAACLRL